MLQTLRQPRWIILTVFVVVVAAVFIRLGIWQLDRLEERRELNAEVSSRLESEPVSLEDLLEEAAGDFDSIQYRRVLVDGVFDPDEEVLIRSQVELGQAGFHVITPLTSSTSVLINRGWVPLTMDQPPVDALPPVGETEVVGWVHLSEERPTLGREDPAGDVDVFNRVDVERIGEQLPYPVEPVYVVAMGESDRLPVIVDLPDVEDEGPHLAYAIQWFGFATVGLVGFYFLVRARGGKGSVREG
jgi:surfeit locus 1 family protein